MLAKSSVNQSAIFRQVCELIPPHRVAKLAHTHENVISWHHDLEPDREHAISSISKCDWSQ